MANSDKNIVIQPSIGSTVDQPSITFTGAGNSSITLKVLDDAEGTLSFEGYEGQVFSINNNLSSGVIYSVNDISGFPIIDADASGNVRLSVYSGNVGVGTTLATQKLDVNGTVKATTFSGSGSGLTNVTATTAGTATTATFLGQDADGNIFGGTNAGGGYDPDTGTSLYNIFLGENAGAAIANGDYNTFFGKDSGCSVTTGVHNIIFGCKAGCSLETGSCNVFLGQCAASAATGSSNFVLGHEAGKCMTSGSGNILLTHGGSVDNGAAWTGSNTIAIGKQAGRRLCGSSSNNVFLGKYAGLCVTTGGSNIFIGDQAGCGSNAKTGCNNVVLGKSAGASLSSGDDNVFLGKYVGKCATTGTENFFVGRYAGCGSTGKQNILLGRNAGQVTTGCCNFFVGLYAGRCGTATNNSIFMGSYAGKCTSGDFNVFLGTQAGCAVTSGQRNIYIGQCSGICATKTGSDNIMLGVNTGKCQSSGSNNTFLGACAGRYTRGSYNIGIGDRAGQGSEPSSDGGCNVSIGVLAGGLLRDGADNVSLGRCAAYCNYNGNDRVSIGCGSGYSTTNGNYSVYIGKAAGCYSYGYYNIAIGCGAGQGHSASSDGCRNISIGLLSGCNVQTGHNNIFLGTYAAKTSGTISGCYNLILGCCAGTSLSSGNDNIFLGRLAGNTNSSGGCNIAIGYDVELPSATGDKQMAIGSGTTSWIAGDSSFNVTLTGAPGTGIVTAYTDAGLHVSGIVTATSSIVGAAVTINSTGINVTGIVTATSFEGDGSALTNLPASASSGEFYTGITSSIQIKPLSYQTTVHTFPSTAGRQYVIESISVANIDTSVGVGTTVNIIASIEDATAAEQTYIAYNVPIVNGGLIELLKNPIVAGPSDVIKMWTTNGSYIGTSNAVDVYMNYTNFESTEYKKVYAANTTLNATGETDIYTSSTYPTVFESIHFANRTDSGDYPISVTITNGTTTTYLAKDLVIPRYSTVDILDRHKRIETDAVIAVSIAQTGSIDVILAGKQITS